MSDIHWGFNGPPNPDARGTLPKAVAAVNALPTSPDFIVFTGDLTHTTDDPAERRRRMAEFKMMIEALEVKTTRFLPGEQDASLDRGAAFREHFGETPTTASSTRASTSSRWTTSRTRARRSALSNSPGWGLNSPHWIRRRRW